MPTYGQADAFWGDLSKLTREQKAAFYRVLPHFVEDAASQRYRNSLRVKGVKGAPGVFEMSWAGDGRATFEYGEEVLPGQTHIVWRRIGTHDVFRRP